ncbi:MAG: hypothetical protein KAT41_03880, partial [Candidatus Marinimicrobia bacterium]|nr:hypothetical protein [Candidatus Neomarinimicrobiota bacterium]
MSSFNNTWKFLIIILITGMIIPITIFGADMPSDRVKLSKDSQMVNGPIVPNNWKFHKIGAIWQRVLNTGKLGDDAYQNRTPS